MSGIIKQNPFILPERVRPASFDEGYDHKKFKQWVSDLPVGNVSKVAHFMHNELDRLNRLDMSPVERFSALELLLPSLSFSLDSLSEYFSAKPVPLSKKNRSVARLHLELLVRVVIAYKAVLAQFHDDSFTGYLLHKHTRSEATRRVLYFLGEILLHEYLIYRVNPKFVWKEIHGIYHYAMQNGLQHKEVGAKADDPFDYLSIRNVYKRILLLALAGPNSLLKGEVKKVNRILIQWLPQVVIIPIDQDASTRCRFFVDAYKDEPPSALSFTDREKIKTGWVLVTDKLIDLLGQEIDCFKDECLNQIRPKDAVSIKLLSKLQAAWGEGIGERENRESSENVIDVACGLESLYQLFGGDRLPDEVKGKTGSAFYTLDTMDIDQMKPAVAGDECLIDMDAPLSSGLSQESEVVLEEVELDICDAMLVEEIESRACVSVNKSSRGYYLTWPGEGEYKVRVGELIGVNPRKNLDMAGAWSLGVIRWLRIQNSGLMGFGVELLDGEIDPVRFERWYDRKTKADIMLGFQRSDKGKLESVMTPPFYIGEKDRFQLVRKGQSIPVAPKQILECTDAIMRFKVKIDDEVNIDKAERKKHIYTDDPVFNIDDYLPV